MTPERPQAFWKPRLTPLLVTLRVLATTTIFVVLYYAVPLNHLTGRLVAVPLGAGILMLLGVAAWELRSVAEAKNPNIRAIEALAAYIPLFLVVFAASYYLMSRADPASFNIQHLTRTDTLYFTITVFSTVGFGDINATSQVARIIVMIQIVLNLLLLGAGLRLLTQAVQTGANRRQAEQPLEENPPSP